MLVAGALCLVLFSVACDETQKASADSGPEKVPPIEVRRGHVASWPRVITGRITDTDGQPVPGALIEWGPVYPADAAREKTVSADDGTYRLEILKAGRTYRLSVSAEGLGPQVKTGIIPGPASAPTEVSVQLHPETTLEVAVVGESGAPIPGIEITPMTPRSGFNSSFSMVQQPELIPGHDAPTRCSDLGLCRLSQLPPAPEPLKELSDSDTDAQKAYAERFNQESWLFLKITSGGEWVHEHQISRKEFFESHGRIKVVVPDYRNPLTSRDFNGTVYAQVFDSDGRPVGHYDVGIRYRGEPLAVNDPGGRFEWGGTLNPQREYEFRIFARGYVPFVERIVPKDTSPSSPRRIDLIRHPSAEFRLVDKRTEEPIGGVPVVTGVAKKDGGYNYVEWNDLKNYSDGHHCLETVLHVVSDANGRITVPEGEDQATLIILTAGYGREVITPQERPEPGKNGVIQIPLEPAATIRATRAPNSRIAQQGDRVYLDFQSSDGFASMFHSLSLDDKGESVIDSLAPGTYQAGLMHSDGAASTACWLKSIRLEAGQQLELPLGEMTGTLTVSGRTRPLTDVSLRPKPNLPGVDVNATDISVVATMSDIDGYFELNGLQPGIYDVEQGRLSRVGRAFRSLVGRTLKGPMELFLVVDTHIDYITGTVEPPESAVEEKSPGK